MSTMTHPDAEIIVDKDVPLVRIIREFDAPAAKVYRAHVDPELFVQWVGPDYLTSTVVVWDARTGGSYRYTMVDGDRTEGFNGVFHELRENELIVQTFSWEGMPDGVALEKAVFEDLPRRSFATHHHLARRLVRGPRRLRRQRHGGRRHRGLQQAGRPPRRLTDGSRTHGPLPSRGAGRESCWGNEALLGLSRPPHGTDQRRPDRLRLHRAVHLDRNPGLRGDRRAGRVRQIDRGRRQRVRGDDGGCGGGPRRRPADRGRHPAALRRRIRRRDRARRCWAGTAGPRDDLGPHHRDRCRADPDPARGLDLAAAAPPVGEASHRGAQPVRASRTAPTSWPCGP